MTYRPRPYGLGPYGDDLYSHYRQPDLAPTIMAGRSQVRRAVTLRDVGFTGSLQARSSTRARIVENAVVYVGVLTGQSSSSANARLYWEHQPPSKCGNDWVVQPKPPYVCPEMSHG